MRIIFLYQSYLGNYQWKDQCGGKGGGFYRLTHRITYPDKPGHSKKGVFLTMRPNLVRLQVLNNFGETKTLEFLYDKYLYKIYIS